MNRWQRDVRDFEYTMFGRSMPPKPTKVDDATCRLRIKLIEEEVQETIEGLIDNDLEAVADGIADAIYVLLGTAVACGIDLVPIWDEVQRSNMAKVGGPIAEDGKQLKPAGWTPPDIAGELRKQGWEG